MVNLLLEWELEVVIDFITNYQYIFGFQPRQTMKKSDNWIVIFHGVHLIWCREAAVTLKNINHVTLLLTQIHESRVWICNRIEYLIWDVITQPFGLNSIAHDDVIKWKHFPRYWPFVRGIHRSPVNSPHKGQWRGALMFSLICVWINGWVNNRKAGDLRLYRAHYDGSVMVWLGRCWI